jgi:hypothetical protein
MLRVSRWAASPWVSRQCLATTRQHRKLVSKPQVVYATQGASRNAISRGRAMYHEVGSLGLKAAASSMIIVPSIFGILSQTTQCDASKKSEIDEQTKATEIQLASKKPQIVVWLYEFRRRLRRYIRMWLRAMKLSVTMSPLLLLYPFHLLTQGATQVQQQNEGGSSGSSSQLRDWWFDLLLYCVEQNGAAMIKLLQVSS